jgi:hypothetical protein
MMIPRRISTDSGTPRSALKMMTATITPAITTAIRRPSSSGGGASRPDLRRLRKPLSVISA